MIIIVMGVSGSGKTTIGQLLAKSLDLPFYDADDFHPQLNIEKMTGGVPLTDTDRWPWLESLGANIRRWENEGGAVLACSALKEQYRTVLQTIPSIHWIYLSGSRSLILERLEFRKEHYMSGVLLDSQFTALEQPAYGIHVDVSLSPELIVEDILIKLNDMIPASEIGLMGLGVMGKSLALNLAEKGVHVAVYNRHVAGREEGIARQLMADNPSLSNLKGFDKVDEFIQSLARPRKVMLMIYAGAVDEQLEELIGLLEPGDVVIDGGNSSYKDTARRAGHLASKEIHFIGTGISGGEEGARKGPSIMAGGSERGYVLGAKYLELIAAKDKAGNPCASYIGPGGAGHFVKMVHNGIEYAEMQVLAEFYGLLRDLLGISPEGIADTLQDWQTGDVGSYLLQITIDILGKKEEDGLLLDNILDQAEQKGTGGLSTAAALEYGVPYSPLSEAVMARFMSAMKAQRVKAAPLYPRQPLINEVDRDAFIGSLKNAYQAARIINHDIGFNLMLQAARHHHWELDLSEIARIWTNGCIIRSVLMEELSEILKSGESILTSAVIIPRLRDWSKDLAFIVASGLQQGFALPVLSASLNYFLAATTADSPANLIQAQRDYFGAHTYQRNDQPAGQYFHTIWKP
jgi:6-phosphogluconate dehydrogenase